MTRRFGRARVRIADTTERVLWRVLPAVACRLYCGEDPYAVYVCWQCRERRLPR